MSLRLPVGGTATLPKFRTARFAGGGEAQAHSVDARLHARLKVLMDSGLAVKSANCGSVDADRQLSRLPAVYVEPAAADGIRFRLRRLR